MGRTFVSNRLLLPPVFYYLVICRLLQSAINVVFCLVWFFCFFSFSSRSWSCFPGKRNWKGNIRVWYIPSRRSLFRSLDWFPTTHEFQIWYYKLISFLSFFDWIIETWFSIRYCSLQHTYSRYRCSITILIAFLDCMWIHLAGNHLSLFYYVLRNCYAPILISQLNLYISITYLFSQTD
jgi:hypothetical protein